MRRHLYVEHVPRIDKRTEKNQGKSETFSLLNYAALELQHIVLLSSARR
jgi:hypothetical protein